MITQVVYLEKYDWLVKAFYEVEPEDSDIILDELDSIDCDPTAFYALADQLEAGNLNTGFTYTDSSMHVTFIVISKTTCAAEFQNTFDHEKGHAAVHIAKYYDMNLEDEEFQYLQGEIGKKLFEVAKRFMCDHCRVNFYNYGKIKMKFY